MSSPHYKYWEYALAEAEVLVLELPRDRYLLREAD